MSVITLAEAKEHLILEAGTTDAKVQRVLDAAERAVAEKCGPLTSVATTERVNGGGTGLVVKATPMVSLTSVTPVGGSAYDVTQMSTDLAAGVIEWTSGAHFTTGRYDVVYQAGRSSLPEDLRLGILELVRHKWDTQRGGGTRPGPRTSDSFNNFMPGAAYTFPFSVMELIGPHIQVGN